MKNKKLLLLVLLFVFAFLKVNAAPPGQNPSAPDQGSQPAPPPLGDSYTSSPGAKANVKVGPGFYDQYKEFLNQMPQPTAFNGAYSQDLEGVFPAYKFPFSVFKIDLDGGQSYEKGDTVNLKAHLSENFKGSEIGAKVMGLCKEKVKDASKCTGPEADEITEFSNLNVFVQVWRKDQDKTNDKGDYLVDEFYAQENLALKSGDSKDFPLNWKIPSDIKPGNYYFVLSLNKDKRFDILGNPLTVMDGAKTFEFQVTGGNSSGIELDKNNIKINNQDYAYRRPAPTIKPGEVTVQIPLGNLGSTAQKVNVKYEVFRWGQTNPKDLINSKTETVDLAPNSKNTLTYVFAPNEIDSVYDIRVTASTQNSQSMSNVRFVIDGKNQGIFRYLDIVKNKDGYMPLVCLRNANWTGQFQGKLKITLNNNTFEKDGTMDSKEDSCFLIRDPKMKLADGGCAKLKGEILTKDGKVTDSDEAILSCNAQAKEAPTPASINQNGGGKNVLIVFLVVVFAGIVGYLIYSRKTNK